MHIEGSEIILNCNNIGYRVLIGTNFFHSLQLKIGDEKELVVYTSVKEDELKLFGFESFFARRVFTILLTVNGVGPKAAVNIVDQIPAPQIIMSIQKNDFEPFLSVSGIGKKTAQRIILDLQGKLKNIELDTAYTEHLQEIPDRFDRPNLKTDLITDAKSALLNLGFNEKEVQRAIGIHVTDKIDLDVLIRRCLGDLHK